MRLSLLVLPLAAAVLFDFLRPESPDAHPGIHEQEKSAKEALEESPQDPLRHVSLGRVYAEKKEWDAALAAYTHAARLGADRNQIFILEGVAYLGAGWPRMARAGLRKLTARVAVRCERREASEV